MDTLQLFTRAIKSGRLTIGGSPAFLLLVTTVAPKLLLRLVPRLGATVGLQNLLAQAQ